MKTALVCTILFLCVVVTGQDSIPICLACGNTYHYEPDLNEIRLDGQIFYNSDKFPVSIYDRKSLYCRTRNERWQQNEAKLLRKYQSSKNFKHHSDYGVALMHNGKAKEALKIFTDIISKHPDEYPIAANLGTAYELVGDNLNALKWISRAMELHPGSHEGTEWLHIAILEAKINLEANPNWLDTHSIIDIDFGHAKKPKLPGNLKNNPELQEKIFKALQYQLRERIQFVAPSDPVVARLMFDLSNFVAMRYPIYNAWELNQIAIKYSNSLRESRFQKTLHKRNDFYFRQIDDSPKAEYIRKMKPIVLFVIFCLAALAIPAKFFLDDLRLKDNQESSD